MPDWTTRSRISPLAAVRLWSFWLAMNCRVSRLWMINSPMIRLPWLFILLLAIAGLAAAQTENIEADFAENKPKYTREFFSMGEDASSGYDYVFYKSGPKIVMIRVIWSASYTNELRIDDFYFDDAIKLHRRQTATKRRLSLLKRGRDVPF